MPPPGTYTQTPSLRQSREQEREGVVAKQQAGPPLSPPGRQRLEVEAPSPSAPSPITVSSLQPPGREGELLHPHPSI